MKKNHFTEAEICQLRELFLKKETASYAQQKGIRAKMRRIGFYITDYANSMNLSDFEVLVNSWKKDMPNIAVENTPKEPLLKEKFHQLSENKNDEPAVNIKKGLEPWEGDSPRVLILGTLPSDVSIREQAYYQNKSHNSFWKIMHALWPNDAQLGDEEFVKAHHIALWDCLHSAEREGSMDSGFGAIKRPNNIQDFLQKHSSIKAIILNGIGETTDSFDCYFGKLREEHTVRSLTSTSNANPRSFESKLEDWKIVKEICDR